MRSNYFFEIHNIFLRSPKIFWDLIRFLRSNFLRSKEIFWYQKLWILLIVACQNPKYNIKIWIAFVKITKNIKSAPLAHHLRPIFGLVFYRRAFLKSDLSLKRQWGPSPIWHYVRSCDESFPEALQKIWRPTGSTLAGGG